jgi:hypothetical protein
MKCPLNNGYIVIYYELNNHIFDDDVILEPQSGAFAYTLSTIDGNNYSLSIENNVDPLTEQDFDKVDFLCELEELLKCGWAGYIITLCIETGEATYYDMKPSNGKVIVITVFNDELFSTLNARDIRMCRK